MGSLTSPVSPPPPLAVFHVVVRGETGVRGLQRISVVSHNASESGGCNEGESVGFDIELGDSS